MSTNSELLRKADLAIADLESNGGVLSAEQGNQFIRKLIDSPTILSQVRVVEMLASQRKINKIGFGKRIMRAATSATALDTAAIEGTFDPLAEATARAKPTTEQIELNTKEVIAEVQIPYDVMEDNIERATAANNENSNTGPGGLRDTIISMIAERAALDLEELGLLGDTTIGAADPYLTLVTGFIKNGETNGNVYDALNATISKDIFKQGLKTMPNKYLRQPEAMKNFVSFNNEIEYRDTLANRGTALGDVSVTGNNPLMTFGSRVERAALMPEDKGMLTHPKNLLMGIQRKVSLEFDKNIYTRTYGIVLTARVDFQVEETEAMVIYQNIASE